MILCQVYKSARTAEMYLYAKRGEGLDKVPPLLLKQFGEAIPVMDLKLDGERKLARVDVLTVMAALAEPGYFLQMPPTPAGLEASASIQGRAVADEGVHPKSCDGPAPHRVA